MKGKNGSLMSTKSSNMLHIIIHRNCSKGEARSVLDTQQQMDIIFEWNMYHGTDYPQFHDFNFSFRSLLPFQMFQLKSLILFNLDPLVCYWIIRFD